MNIFVPMLLIAIGVLIALPVGDLMSGSGPFHPDRVAARAERRDIRHAYRTQRRLEPRRLRRHRLAWKDGKPNL